MSGPDETLERAHRLSFGRLVGWLFRMTGDIQLAEDAVSAAFVAALVAWRRNGVPDSPEAWLRVVARNEAVAALRKNSRATTVAPESFAELADERAPSTGIDDRLALLFVCAHPAIDPRLHAPLMLQAVLGIDAARIASVFLVPPTTMGQRLARAKARIRDAGIRYEVPEPAERAPRLAAVLQAIYAAYGLADPTAGAVDVRDSDLREEAIRLAALLTELLPGEPETWGLYSLVLHTESRRPARVVGEEFVPLLEQDTALWSREQREQADWALTQAAKLGRAGRFQLEAAISAVHSSRADGVAIDWDSIAVLYRGLLAIAPSIGATIGAASVMIEIGEHEQAAQLLDSLPAGAVRDHQPYWVCRARLAAAMSDLETARSASDRAIGLTSNAAVRRYLVASRPGAAPSP